MKQLARLLRGLAQPTCPAEALAKEGFKRKLEFFIFAPLLRGWPKAGFPHF